MSISFKVTDKKPSSVALDALILPVTNKRQFSTNVPPSLKSQLTKNIRKRKFKGEWGQTFSLIKPTPSSPALIMIAGLGEHGATTKHAEALRRGLGSALSEARRHQLKHVGIDLSAFPNLIAAAVEGASLANYRFTEHSKKLRRQDHEQAVTKITLFITKENTATARRNIIQTRTIMQGVKLARELINQPADRLSPIALVNIARQLAKDNPSISLKVLNKAEAKRENFTAFLAVAQGSILDPYVIHLTYKPDQPADTKIALVGKGITFDSGGLSIKPADGMVDMKIDMGGAATVLGVFLTLQKLGPAVEVHGIIATCENMPSGTAYRPGDVVTAKNGKTIEVKNTDAEGRLTLADALTYAAELKPKFIIDIATLTGACIVGLGETVAGLWSSDDNLQESILKSARHTGENITALPMPQEYREQINSSIADLCNISTSRYGGAITAAMFLREFTAGIPWAHLDIAGPVSSENSTLPYFAKGATGFGVRTLIDMLFRLAKQKTITD